MLAATDKSGAPPFLLEGSSQVKLVWTSGADASLDVKLRLAAPGTGDGEPGERWRRARGYSANLTSLTPHVVTQRKTQSESMLAPLARSRTFAGSASRVLLRSAFYASSLTLPTGSASAAPLPNRCISTTLLRRSQNEGTKSPARSHRLHLPCDDQKPQSGKPGNSSITFSQASAASNVDRTEDLASGLQGSHSQMDSREGDAAGIPGALADSFRASLLSGLSAQAGSPSSLSSLTPPSIFAPGPSVGYTSSTLPTRSDELLEAFVNLLQRKGNKSLATKQVLGMLHHVSLALNNDPLPALREAVDIASPLVKTTSFKSRAKVIHVPFALNARQMRAKGIRAIIEASAKRGEREIERRLAKEVIATLEGNSEVIRKKEETHREAVRNRANVVSRPR